MLFPSFMTSYVWEALTAGTIFHCKLPPCQDLREQGAPLRASGLRPSTSTREADCHSAWFQWSVCVYVCAQVFKSELGPWRIPGKAIHSIPITSQPRKKRILKIQKPLYLCREEKYIHEIWGDFSHFTLYGKACLFGWEVTYSSPHPSGSGCTLEGISHTESDTVWLWMFSLHESTPDRVPGWKHPQYLCLLYHSDKQALIQSCGHMPKTPNCRGLFCIHLEDERLSVDRHSNPERQQCHHLTDIGLRIQWGWAKCLQPFCLWVQKPPTQGQSRLLWVPVTSYGVRKSKNIQSVTKCSPGTSGL